MDTKKTIIIALVALASTAIGYALLGLQVPQSAADGSTAGASSAAVAWSVAPRVVDTEGGAPSGAVRGSDDRDDDRYDDDHGEYEEHGTREAHDD